MQIKQNHSLKPYNTFGIDVKCTTLITLEDEQEIFSLIEQGVFTDTFMVLGGGSNVLFTDDFAGTIIQLKNKGIEVVEEDNDEVVLKVAAGEVWGDFVGYCIQNQYYGIENLSAIPGWVGSSPVQNIGAYGVEVKDAIEKVEGVEVATGKLLSFNAETCQFDYRSSIFKTEWKNRIIITHVYFRLKKKEQYNLSYTALKEKLTDKILSLESIANAVRDIRDSKLPDVRTIGSAGSFFKNPVIDEKQFLELQVKYPQLIHYPAGEGKVKLAAGQLIDMCGWKGKREGDVGCFPQQALVIVNYGTATGKEVSLFAAKIQASVWQHFGIAIAPEVLIK